MSENIEHYRQQIALARTEIKNLRQQLSSLKHEHIKEIKLVKSALNGLQCSNCADTATTVTPSHHNHDAQPSTSTSHSDDLISYRPIGIIETTFQNKRGVPRQPSIMAKARGAVVIDQSVFNNPEHALSGLQEFSHMCHGGDHNRASTVWTHPASWSDDLRKVAGSDWMGEPKIGFSGAPWGMSSSGLVQADGATNFLNQVCRIIYHFHATESNSVPAKVSPPRLGGERRGVLSTRSPHRPCPIGLSLVNIQAIEGNKVYFLGVDMVNGTPVLDIKPFIPQYDYPPPALDPPLPLVRPPTEGISDAADAVAALHVDDDGFDIRSLSPRLAHPIGIDTSPTRSPYEDEIPSPVFDDQPIVTTPVSPPPGSSSVTTGARNRQPDSERGAPDGQERFTPPQSAHLTNMAHDGIRVAPWIADPPTQPYEVRFTDDVINRLNELIGDRAEAFKSNIQSLLSEDPRSNYVRRRYPDHEYSCVLEDLSISCVFDSNSSVCTIIAVRSAEDMQQ